MKRSLILFVTGIFLLGACSGSASGIQVSDAWTRSALKDGNGAVYFLLQNHSSEEDTLTGVASEVARAVEIHETKMDGDVMQMQQVRSISLPGYSKVEFAPGGLHVMLIGLGQDLKAGEEIEITLQFTKHEDITIKVPVQELPGDASMNEH